MAEAQRRAAELKNEEAALAKWKDDLFQKVDRLRNENAEMENRLRLSVEEIERLKRCIRRLDRPAQRAQAAETVGGGTWPHSLATSCLLLVLVKTRRWKEQ